jgi:hypothetical protein
MIGKLTLLSFHIPGTLAANLNIRWAAPFAGRIKHVSAVASNDSDATLAVGDSGDDDAILAAAAIGDSGVPAEFDVDNWAATNPTAGFAEGDVLVFTLDFDGSAGTAAQNVTIVATLLEGGA